MFRSTPNSEGVSSLSDLNSVDPPEIDFDNNEDGGIFLLDRFCEEDNEEEDEWTPETAIKWQSNIARNNTDGSEFLMMLDVCICFD